MIPSIDQNAIRPLLRKYTGLDETEHSEDTPTRFLTMLDELTRCKYDSVEHIERCIKWKSFPAESQDLVLVEAIPLVSVCNHHVIPIIGKAHIAYVPDRRVAGLSKFARTVHHYARRLQVQERMTRQIAEHIKTALDPLGVGVIIRAEHMCMTIRGVQTPGTYTTTASMSGVFADHTKTAKAEFLSFVNGNGKH